MGQAQTGPAGGQCAASCPCPRGAVPTETPGWEPCPTLERVDALPTADWFIAAKTDRAHHLFITLIIIVIAESSEFPGQGSKGFYFILFWGRKAVLEREGLVRRLGQVAGQRCPEVPGEECRERPRPARSVATAHRRSCCSNRGSFLCKSEALTSPSL